MSEKTKKIVYYFFTLWLSLGMVSTAIVQLMKLPEEVQKISELGYPTYFLTLLGVWKLLGVVAVLAPKSPLLKEWAYAGFFFAMSGAAYSHIVCGHPMTEIFPSLLLLALTITSWYLRPKERKLS
ncbi:DoxX family protein [Leptospira sp. 96542]|nr:DoxX family protein [Leptospira sp. 96542]